MYIVFDIGGNKTRIASSSDKQSLENVTITKTAAEFESGFQDIVNYIDAVAADNKIEGIAGGIAGLIKDNELVASINLSGWVKKGLAERLAEKYSCTTELQNDAAIGALGEAVFGAGKQSSSMVYLTIGTGIGGAWVVNRQLQNSTGTFEPGHQYIDYTSGKDLEEMIDSTKDLPEREKYIACGIHNALMFWPSELVVLGGGKILHYDWSIENIQQEIRNLKPNYQYEIRMEKTSLKDEAGLYGALTKLN